MTDLVVDGVEKTWDGVVDFGAWLADELPLEFVHAEVRGAFETSIGVNLTARRKGHVIDLSRCELRGRGCPAVLDLTDSAGITIVGGLIVGDDAQPPGVGVLQSRCSEEEYRSAGGHVLRNVSVVGAFTQCALGNLGAETLWYDHPRLHNSIGPALIFAARNTHGFASSWRTADNQRTATVASVHCADVTAYGTQKAAVIVDGFDRVHFSGLLSIATGHDGILVDCTQSGIVGPVIDDLYCRSKKTIARAALVYRGRNGIVSHYVRASQMLPSVAPQRPLVVEDAVPFRHCEWIHHETTLEDWGAGKFDGAAPSRIWRRGSEQWLP